MNLWNKIKEYLKSFFSKGQKVLFAILMETKKDVSKFLNDPELQRLALEAVKKAALAKLTGNVAWEAAYAAFTVAVKEKGLELGTALLETILQTAYLYFKFTEGNGVEKT